MPGEGTHLLGEVGGTETTVGCFLELAGSGSSNALLQKVFVRRTCREWLSAEIDRTSVLNSAKNCKYWAKSLHLSLFWPLYA